MLWKVDGGAVSHMVNLTTMAPEIVATIIDETLASEGTQSDLAVAPPPLWQEQ